LAQDWLDGFLAAEGLPDRYRLTIARAAAPIAALAQAARAAKEATTVVGLCGSQGSGKSTLAKAVAALLRAGGLTVAVVSLDDLYLTHEARRKLAAEVHPLLATRGPPGTHDVALGVETLDALAGGGPVALPRFDKAADDPRPVRDWPVVAAPVDVAIFEGWCVGARAQGPARLVEPVNALERDEDPDGHWRTFVDTALAGAYPPLFERLDRLVLLAAPGFEVVAGWRAEQEAKLTARTGRGLPPAEIARFVAHYERLTRWILAEMPARADLTIALGADRTPV
jgi:D-glycerate 3-kinase